MDKLVGVQVFPGTTVAPLLAVYDHKVQVMQFSIEPSEIENEFARFSSSIEASKQEFLHLREKHLQGSDEKLPTISEEIINIYIMLLEDSEFHLEVKNIITHSFTNAEWAVKKAIQNYTSKLEAIADDYLTERIHDINEIGLKIIHNLVGQEHRENINVDHECILVANNLMPTQLLHIPHDKLLGIVLEEGGATSHTAIIAKAYGIPMLIGVKNLLESIKNHSIGVLDATNNTLLLGTTDETKQQYRNQMASEQAERESLLQQISHKAHSSPLGTKLVFELNLDVIEELDTKASQYAHGVGLFRSEFLLEEIADYHDSEEIQFSIYKSLLEKMQGKQVTIRTFDAGGDKSPVSVTQINEENPLLGLRGIRYCLADKLFFSSQLKALLRAAVFGNLRILIPMVSSIEEILGVRKLITQAMEHLDSRGVAYTKDVPLGIMIEVPSILYILPEISEHCDFFSVGTNDLLQYTLATDRDNSYVSNLYSYYQPSFLRVLRDLFYQAYTLKKDISLCGEMASYEKTIPLLLGAGLRKFSVSPSQLANTIATATSFKISDSRMLFERVLTCKTMSEVAQQVEDFHREYHNNNR